MDRLFVFPVLIWGSRKIDYNQVLASNVLLRMPDKSGDVEETALIF